MSRGLCTHGPPGERDDIRRQHGVPPPQREALVAAAWHGVRRAVLGLLQQVGAAEGGRSAHRTAHLLHCHHPNTDALASDRRQTTVSRPHLSSVFSLAFTFDVQIETLGCCSSRFQPNVLGQERRGLGVPAATISCSVPNCFRCSSWLSRDLADAPTTLAQRSWRRKRHVLQPIASAARRALRAPYMSVVVG